MGWREMMGVKEKQHPKTYPRYPYNPQNSSGETNSADITDITHRDEDISHSKPQAQSDTRRFNSKALGRVVEIEEDPRYPDDITFDGVHYTRYEMRKLKGLADNSLVAAHDIKRIFEGEVL